MYCKRSTWDEENRNNVFIRATNVVVVSESRCYLRSRCLTLFPKISLRETITTLLSFGIMRGGERLFLRKDARVRSTWPDFSKKKKKPSVVRLSLKFNSISFSRRYTAAHEKIRSSFRHSQNLNWLLFTASEFHVDYEPDFRHRGEKKRESEKETEVSSKLISSVRSEKVQKCVADAFGRFRRRALSRDNFSRGDEKKERERGRKERTRWDETSKSIAPVYPFLLGRGQRRFELPSRIRSRRK